MHPKEDTGGNQKESQTHRKADVRKTQCSKGAQVGDDGPVKMRGNADDAGKEEEEKSEGQHRDRVGQQGKQTAKAGGNPFSTVQVVKQRKNVPEDRRGNQQGKRQRRDGWLVLGGQVLCNRKIPLKKVAEQGTHAAEKAALQKGVGGAGVAVGGVLGDVLVGKQQAEQPCKQDAAQKIAKADEENFSKQHG